MVQEENTGLPLGRAKVIRGLEREIQHYLSKLFNENAFWCDILLLKVLKTHKDSTLKQMAGRCIGR